jgi:hypothetical protein
VGGYPCHESREGVRLTILMDYTDVGRSRISATISDDLRFDITHVAYGDDYNVGTPTSPNALVPASTALVSEVYRKEIPPGNITKDQIYSPYGLVSVYTTVSGIEFSSVVGEIGLFATVTDPGTTGLSVGDQFLLAQAHIPRIVFSIYQRLALKWPLDLRAP